MFKILRTYICLKKYIKYNIWRVAVRQSNMWIIDKLMNSFIHQYSALRPVRQEPELSQVTCMALAHCILSKFLGVGCHFFPPEENNEQEQKWPQQRTVGSKSRCRHCCLTFARKNVVQRVKSVNLPFFGVSLKECKVRMIKGKD